MRQGEVCVCVKAVVNICRLRKVRGLVLIRRFQAQNKLEVGVSRLDISHAHPHGLLITNSKAKYQATRADRPMANFGIVGRGEALYHLVELHVR
jgi:hypothetical protein